MGSLVSFEGTVTELSWRNPHVYFSVETVSAQGERIEWTLQLGSTITTTRMGWTRESLAVGEGPGLGPSRAQWTTLWLAVFH